MYKIETYEEKSFVMYQLSSEDNSSWIKVCPERGGIIIGYGVDGKEYLYLNEETLYDRKQNVRGGIPILFPISGQLKDKKYDWDGKTYEMPNHGLARIHPWEVIDTKCDEEKASISILFESSIGTKGTFPFDFEVVFTYTLKQNQLFIHQSYRNMDTKQMPIYPGLHPYFKAKSKVISLDTEATTYFDYNDNEEKPFDGKVDMEGLKEAVVLETDHQKLEAKYDEHIDLHIETGSEFRYTVLWTQAGKDFVCIEPFAAKTGELNRKDELIMVEPKDSLETWVSFQIV
ncbi:Aldose 1-epimerase [Paraliobacillus sp. PM-2]|uniref:aldose epimerase family protein n=1 Tax=Paraliobacillus sp. PM-2 TaxID=1462524 RepID=UPI00061BD555|nr:aldose epimerase [Paraliobacillus sp. PM-2]CQR46353.1 Aldose 1-epimerase [Paraliobacillus sp. PM-2]